jgi:hypothetical protein
MDGNPTRPVSEARSNSREVDAVAAGRGGSGSSNLKPGKYDRF